MRSEYSFTVSSDSAIDVSSIYESMFDSNQSYCVVEGVEKGLYVCMVNGKIAHKARYIDNPEPLKILKEHGAYLGEGEAPKLVTHSDVAAIRYAVQIIMASPYAEKYRKKLTITVKGVKL